MILIIEGLKNKIVILRFDEASENKRVFETSPAFWILGIVALSFVFGNYCPIIN